MLNSDKLLKHAYWIAKRGLKECSTRMGIIAGRHHFTDLWARDSFFASFGANVSGLENNTLNTLQTFLLYQRPDGLIPYRILRSPTTPLKYAGSHFYFKNPRPNFRSHQSGGLVLDGGLMTIIAFGEYIKMKKDTKMINRFFPGLAKAYLFYLDKFKNNLISEWFLCEWSDSIMKSGAMLYTNILYWKASVSMAYLARYFMKEPKIAEAYESYSGRLKNLIYRTFWTGDYLADWVDWKRHDYYNAMGNMLAVWWDFLEKKDAGEVVNYAAQYLNGSFTLATNYPKYPFWRVNPLNMLIGMGDYHNQGLFWLQNGILFSLSLMKLGRMQKAKEILRSISFQIVRHNTVAEVYEKDGKPLNRFIYKAERPFAWSCGLYLYAYQCLMNGCERL